MALRFEITGDNSNLLSSLEGARHGVQETAAYIEKYGRTIEDVFARIGAAAGVSLGFEGAKSLFSKVMDMRSYFQDIESSMEVFLGSAEKGRKFMEELKSAAYYNMFEFTDLANASKQLIAYRNDVETVIPTIQKLSDIAVGTSAPLLDLVNLYNKAKSTGQVSAQDMASWAVKGVVIKDVLREMGETAVGTSVSFEQLNKVIEHVTSEGGMFYQLQERMMSNISAEIGQFQDNVASMLNEIGEKHQDEIVGIIKIGSELVDNYQTIAEWIQDVVVAYGSYRAALALCLAVDKAVVYWKGLEAEATMMNTLANAGEAKSVTALAIAKLRLIKATKSLNAAMLANPYVLVAAGIAAVTYAVYKLATAETEMEKAQKRLDERFEEANAAIHAEQGNVDLLFRSLRKAKEETTEYGKAKDAIMDKYGDYLKGLKGEIATLNDVEGAYKAITKAVRASILARQEEAALSEINETYGKAYAENIAKLQKALAKAVGDDLATEYLKKIQGELAETGEISKGTADAVRELFRGSSDYGNSTSWLRGLRDNERYLKQYTEQVHKRFAVVDYGTPPEEEKIRDKEAIAKEIKELQAQLAALSREDALGEKGDALKKAIRDRQKDLAAYEVKSSRDDAARRQKRFELDQELYEGLAEKSAAARNAIIQARIASIEDEGVRMRAAEDEQHRLNLEAIGKREDEMKKALYAYNKSVWETDNKDAYVKYSDTAEGKAGWQSLTLSQDEQDELKAMLEKENAEYARIIRQRYRDELDAMRSFLKEYGSFEQKRLAVAEEYAEKTSKARTEGEKLRLQKERDQKLASLQYQNIAAGIDWKALFSGVGTLSKDMMKPMMDKLMAFTKTDDYLNADTQTQQQVVDLIQELRQYLGTDQSMTWQALAKATEDFVAAVGLYNDAVEEEQRAISARDEYAKKQGSSDFDKAEYDRLAVRADELGKATADAKESMDAFATTLNDTSEQVANFTSSLTAVLNNAKGWQGVQGFGDVKQSIGALDSLKGSIDTALPAMGEGIGKTVSEGLSSAIGSGLKSIGGGLSSVLSSGLGTVIGFIAQIPRLILDIIGAIKSFVTGVLDAITELISLRWIDDLVVSICDAIGGLIDAIFDLPENIYKVLEAIVVKGIGGLLNTILGRLGNIFSFGALSSKGPAEWFTNSNAKEVADAMEKLTVENKNLEQAIDDLTDEMKTARGAEAIETSRRAEELQKQTIENYKAMAQAQAGYHGHHNSWGYYWDGYDDEQISRLSKQIGRTWNGDIWDLTPEEMKMLRSNVDMWDDIKNNGKSYYGEAVQEKLNDYIEQAGKLQEITDALYENLTTTTKDNVFDDFLGSLYDLADGSEDVFDDIAEAWQRMVNKMVVNNLVGGKFQQQLDGWYEELARLNEERANETITDVDYRRRLEALKAEYEGYVRDAQRDLETLRDEGIIKATDDTDTYRQEASSRGFQAMSQATGEELSGRFTALQIAGESVAGQVASIYSQMLLMTQTQAGNNTYLQEMRNMMIASNSYLEDIAKYSKKIYLDFSDKMDSIVDNTKNM